MTSVTGTLNKSLCSFVIISCSAPLRMRNFSHESCRENQNTHLMFNDFFLNRAAYEVIGKNIVQLDRQQMTIWRKRIACWIPKATNTHSEYVIINDFLLQQWLHESP